MTNVLSKDRIEGVDKMPVMNTCNSTSKLNTSKGSVDETKQLRKENQDLRKEIDDLKAKIENISKNLAKQGEQPK